MFVGTATYEVRLTTAYERLVAEHDLVEHARPLISQELHCSDSEPVVASLLVARGFLAHGEC